MQSKEQTKTAELALSKEASKAIQKEPITKSEYKKLFNDIRTLIKNGIENPSKKSASNIIKTYWNIGFRINKEHLLSNSGYHNSILKDLSEDLNLERSTLSIPKHKSIDSIEPHPNIQ